jgi:hypothetical protein
MTHTCPQCGREFTGHNHRKFCSLSCLASSKTGARNAKWRGGRIQYADGKYVAVHNPQQRQMFSSHVAEHILLAEKALGKPLPVKAIVHHIDHDGLHNVNSNLVVCQESYHALIHYREKIVMAGGHPSRHKICGGCAQLKETSEFGTMHRRGHLTLNSQCKSCRRVAFRMYRKSPAYKLRHTPQASETSKRMSRLLENPALKKKWADAQLGRKHTAETKMKMRQNQLGSKNSHWNENASQRSGRDRAQRMYPDIPPCRICGGKAERHHKDHNTKNNDPSNIDFLCRKDHFSVHFPTPEHIERNAKIINLRFNQNLTVKQIASVLNITKGIAMSVISNYRRAQIGKAASSGKALH